MTRTKSEGSETAPAPRSPRLQRDQDFTGNRLTTFREVFLRHGLPGLLLALLCLSLPQMRSALAGGLDKALAAPELYIGFAALIFFALNVHAWILNRQWSVQRLGWIVYLGALSFWEEWVFRLALPEIFQGFGASVGLAALVSAALFGAAHYFTLRWKWPWCVAAFLGGLFLSRQMQVQNDLLLITAFHWVGTYLNTPQPPGQSARPAP